MTDLPPPVRLVLDAGRRYRLSVLHVGLACCAVEFVAASLDGRGIAELMAATPQPDARDVEVMVVAGTVTDALAPAVRALWESLPEPRVVLSFGACSNSGGPYWDSYSVTKGVDQVVPVDVYVPGCPPRPEQLLTALVELQDRLGAAAPS